MPFTPFPLTAGISASSFQLAPIASNTSFGWSPNCTTPACASTATWSTGAVNSTISYSFWGYEVALDGTVQGNMSVKATLDGDEIAWNPSGGTLLRAANLKFSESHSVSLQILSAAPDALLSVNQAQINASTRSDRIVPSSHWLLDSNNEALSYTGFVQQSTNVSGTMSPINYVSSTAGDTVSLRFNASALAIYGPCGPSNGMIRVSIQGEATGTGPTINTINTTKPIQADDCMIYQSSWLTHSVMHNLTVTNEDGRQVGINRVELIHLMYDEVDRGRVAAFKLGTIVCIIIGTVVLFALVGLAIFMRSSKRRQKVNRACALFCS